ncbi:MAG: right-handed parallel beta-helix repeat-containing protein, partial [Candidatus Cloacimonadaceae bacterium]|nr:right-handed parallel beta-helix repeat-containing protein [Candidatus Cloacimonadaceae bacterium]
TIAHNHIHHNRWQGITAWDIVGANALNPFIHNNIIEYNLTGIYLLNASGYVHDNIIRYNFIPGDMNSGAGVMVSGATSEPYFERNIISHNFTGFYITNNARPCLGDLDIYHAWAQGENVIRNNVDAQGVPHSVVCASYPQSGNIIKAENNYWDFDDAAGIASYITDGNDNPSLPIVDFEPFLVEVQPLEIIGNCVYDGSLSLAAKLVQLVSVEDGIVLYQSELPASGLISFQASVELPFYAIVKAAVSGSDQFVYGCSGSITEPLVFDPESETLINLGTIHIVDETPRHYQKIGAPVLHAGHQLYPVARGFFLYAYDTTDWLYRDGDYLYNKIHTRRVDDEVLSWELPPGSIWLKIQNLSDGDMWQVNEIIDDFGTVRSSLVSVFAIVDPPYAFPTASESFLMTKNSLQGEAISQTIYSNYYSMHMTPTVYEYNGNYVERVLRSEHFPLQNDYTLFPLFEGNYSLIEIDTADLQPTRLTMAMDFQNDIVSLYWQAPAPGDNLWSAYRIYRNGEVIGEVPFDQQVFYHANAQIFMDTKHYWVVATD